MLVPAINPDITILHGQKSDRAGTTCIQGLPFADVEQAKAARHVIVTCEEIVDTEKLRQSPETNQLPFFCVDAVVEIPWGAYPTACYRHYDYDPTYLNGYRAHAQDDIRHDHYLQKHIFGVADHAAFLRLQKRAHLKKIEADERTGYAVGLDRR